MNKEEIQSEREKVIAEILSIPYLKDIPYKLLLSEEVPISPLMRSFLYTFEFCRRRCIEESSFDELVGYDFDNDKFLFLLRHNFGIEVNHDANWTLESMKELMLRVERETRPEYRDMLDVERENYNKMREELLSLLAFATKGKKFVSIQIQPLQTSISIC